MSRHRKSGPEHTITSVIDNIDFYIRKLKDLIDEAWEDGESNITEKDVANIKNLRENDPWAGQHNTNVQSEK